MRRAGHRPAPAVAAPVLRTAAAVLPFAALAIFFTWSRTQALQSAYAHGEARRAHDRLVSERDALRLEVETLRSPRALERFARTKLDMAPPAPGAVLAAGPRATAGGAGVDGVGHRPAPAGPPPGRAAAGARAAAEGAARDVGTSGALRVALRGSPRVAPPRAE